MTERSVDVVQRMYAAFHAGDAEGSLACFHPDVWVDASQRVDGGTGRGRDHLNRVISSWIGAFEDWHEEIEEIRAVGGHVYVAAKQTGRGKGSGLQIENRYSVLYEVEGDQITRMAFYPDSAEALEAAQKGD
jgi:ketosteroid isomerase-like protein